MSGGFKTYKWLLPASWLYGLGVRARNLCFDKGLLKSRSFDIPVISVGNITVGGSGKTPHVEYLIRMLRPSFKVAVLSRGYKRATRGFVLADNSSTSRDIGDEPKQIKSKFGDVVVAVDEDRVDGIDRLLSSPATRDIEVVLLSRDELLGLLRRCDQPSRVRGELREHHPCFPALVHAGVRQVSFP